MEELSNMRARWNSVKLYVNAKDEKTLIALEEQYSSGAMGRLLCVFGIELELRRNRAYDPIILSAVSHSFVHFPFSVTLRSAQNKVTTQLFVGQLVRRIRNGLKRNGCDVETVYS
ncbi:MAG: hypothetical protein AB8B79_21760 [Granulosicoccus sp.]